LISYSLKASFCNCNGIKYSKLQSEFPTFAETSKPPECLPVSAVRQNESKRREGKNIGGY
jgi:hypothetical protein